MSEARQLPTPTRAGFCALVGLPNVGKSTLLNRLLQTRLVAVSNKPQTTRNRIHGILHATTGEDERSQIIFIDTPGMQRGKGSLRRYMREEALAAASDCDLAVLIIDLSRSAQHQPGRLLEPDSEALMQSLGQTPTILALNKVDTLADKSQLLPILERYAEDRRYLELVPISARTGAGLDQLVTAIASRLPESPPLFPEHMLTDRAERFLAGELIREQLFRQLGDELPYVSAVQIERFEERNDSPDLRLEAVIYVERESQKGIVIGKGGARIRELGTRARQALGELFDCPVHLKLLVKVAKDWSQRERGLREMGYE